MEIGLRLLTTLTALAAWSCTVGPDAENVAPYPVWWSPELELEGLDRIDERLEQAIWPDGGGFRVHVGLGSDRRTEFARSCADIRRFEREGDGAITSSDVYFWSLVFDKCIPIESLRDAVAAKKSHVNEFQLNAAALNYLPAMLDLSPSCDWECRLFVANAKRIPWREFEPRAFLNIEARTVYAMTVETHLDLVQIDILARADFNGDGWEDLFVRSTTKGKEGRWGNSALFTLTRKESDAVLSVLNPEGHVCSPDRYRPCDTHYDEPPALREAD